MNANEYKFDVAISFLSQDEPLAFELYTRLSESMEVFIYSKKQEEVAGTDGLESFRSAFRQESRLVVVLYRNGWGETPWTRIEQVAITDRLLAEGWKWLFFVMVDHISTPPKWLPETHIHFNIEDFGIEQAIGAIKARLQEEGGHLRKLDVVRQAQLLDQRATFFAERQRLMSSIEGVNAVREQVERIFRRISDKIAEITQTTKLTTSIGHDRDCCVITNGTISLRLLWRPEALNSLENSPLRISEYRGRLLLPGERGCYFNKPQMLSESRFHPEISTDRGWCWTLEAKPNERLISADVADQCVSVYLSLVDKVLSGKIQSPDILDDD